MSPRKQGADMPFIAWTGKEKDDPETRKLIRSRVMMGKNRGKSRPIKRKEPSNRQVVPVSEPTSPDEELALVHVNVPTRLGTELSFTQLPAEVDPTTLADLLRFSAVSKQATVPLEACFYWDKSDTTLSRPLAHDAAYLYCVALGSQTYISIRRGFDKHDAARYILPHFTKAVRLLRERLLSADEVIKISDPTILVVASLAFYARITGDYASAHHHMQGLRRMVDLRGGIWALSHSSKLLMEIIRCDLTVAIECGSTPILFSKVAAWKEPFMPFPDQIAPDNESAPRNSERAASKVNASRLVDHIDADLANIWQAMKKFCSLINHAAEIKRRLPEQLLMQTTASVTYRLLHMAFDTSSLDETIRLGLLGFTSFTFLQWPNFWMESVPLSTRYKECLAGLEKSGTASSEIMLWLLVVGGTAIFTRPDDVWLRPWALPILEEKSITTYTGLRRILDSLLWIDLVFDKPAKRTFDSWTHAETDGSDLRGSPSSLSTTSSKVADTWHIPVLQ